MVKKVKYCPYCGSEDLEHVLSHRNEVICNSCDNYMKINSFGIIKK